MEQIAISLIDKLPDWYLMMLIPVGVWFVFFYVIPHIRRDKQGKLYWHSDRIEAIKHNKKIDDLLNQFKDMSLDLLKNNIYTEKLPLGERMASGIKYIKKGGNGEVKHYVEGELRSENTELYDSLSKIIK